MKTILYVGATLMIGASIYGFIDYKKTSNKKEFTGMYADQPADQPVSNPVVAEPVTKNVAPVAEKKLVNTKHVTNKNIQSKSATKMVDIVEVAPSIKPISDDAKLGTTAIKTIDDASVDTKIAENKAPVKKVVRKKRFDASLFSRAPIREKDYSLDDKEVKKGKN